MLYFPQLTTGAVSQFPITRRATTRTVSNQLPSGDNIRMSDPGASRIQWQLQYKGLTDTEWSALEQFFAAVEGQLNAFTFLDPVDNLLMWSEDWTKPVWTADPMLQVSTGIADPLGGNGAVEITNTGQTTQRIVQNIAGPSWFQYCFSVYLRSDTPSDAQLVLSATGQGSLNDIPTTSSWNRAVKADSLTLQQDGVAFGLQLPAGTRIYAFGPQAEPQSAPGPYVKTTDRAGVYSNARFASDSLAQITNSPNQNSCVIGIVSSLA